MKISLISLALISLAKVSEVVKKLLSGKAPSVDEIRPEMLQALDIFGCHGWYTSLMLYGDGDGAECKATRVRVSTVKSEAIVLHQNKVDCSLWVGSKLLPQVREFKYLRVLFTSDGKMDFEVADRCCISSNAGIVPDCCGKKKSRA